MLQLLAAGRRVKDVAAQLAISPKTVTTHRARILRKLGLATNADLTLYAVSAGLLRDKAL